MIIISGYQFLAGNFTIRNVGKSINKRSLTKKNSWFQCQYTKQERDFTLGNRIGTKVGTK
jgi:hypothetical protein